jgi:hypothetical protein
MSFERCISHFSYEFFRPTRPAFRRCVTIMIAEKGAAMIKASTREKLAA